MPTDKYRCVVTPYNHGLPFAGAPQTRTVAGGRPPADCRWSRNAGIHQGNPAPAIARHCQQSGAIQTASQINGGRCLLRPARHVQSVRHGPALSVPHAAHPPRPHHAVRHRPAVPVPAGLDTRLHLPRPSARAGAGVNTESPESVDMAFIKEPLMNSTLSLRRTPEPSQIKHPDPGVRWGGDLFSAFLGFTNP